WYIVAASSVAVGLSLALSAASERPVAMVPLVIFQCVGLLAAGVITLRRMRAQAGALLYGTAMIALAVHLLNAPVLATRPRLFLWGFAVALALEVVAALGMLVLYYDNARARLLEAQLALEHKRRIEALGLVAGGVAHDFNNMLTVMHGHLDLMRSGRAGSPSQSESLSSLEQALEQAGRLTAQLMKFGRSDTTGAPVLDVSEVVESTLELLRKVMPGQIQLRFQSAAGPHLTNGSRALVEQIVLNLVTNARDAIAKAGVISVEVAGDDDSNAEVLLRVADSGAGMAPELLDRIFQPFFSTKGPGKGTGLGLTTVQEAVNQLGGRLHVESRLGTGTTFQVFLPRAARSRPIAQAN
ncbi:MAG TPA: ATP-binding protein, partial [Polyangiaceae bacterium]